MLRRTLRVRAAAATTGFLSQRAAKLADLSRLPEMVQANKFLGQLRDGSFAGAFTTKGGNKPRPLSDLLARGAEVGATAEQIDAALAAAFATFTLHVESRVASALGKGFYTIGPCGEELLAPIGLVLRNTDPVALHYRHLAPSIARRLRAAAASSSSSSSSAASTLDSVLFDRAKGYCVASTDPICGGHHCCLGGGDADFLVTSTLASQSCPALGRAMGISLSNHLLSSQQQQQQGDAIAAKFPADAVSFVTLGDGSINNAHFLAALNLADYAVHRQFKVPVVFCITDNNICISLRGNNYVERFVERGGARFPTHVGLGSDLVDTWLTTHEAVAAARRTRRPQVLVLRDITRRFGHAATDRQAAYMTRAEIQEWEDRNPLLGLCEALVAQGLYTGADLAQRFEATWRATQEAFDRGDREPKISSRAQVSSQNSAPLVDMGAILPGSAARKKSAPSAAAYAKPPPASLPPFFPQSSSSPNVYRGELPQRTASTHILRKHMNRVFDELLSCEAYRDVVYIGEDVQHGGYYLVTEGLYKKYPARVLDFPPDETSLIGAGMGFSQCGLTPIVEIPYAKYLDCGFDLFTEAVIMHWLSHGKERNGIVFRLQGFGRGVFGGNYHTHNMLHIPPGLDVVCCSRGDDYSRLMRYAVAQARAGRMVMFVDPTEILNMRDVNLGEQQEPVAACWEFPYSEENEFLTFDDVTVYRSETALPPGVSSTVAATDSNSSGGNNKKKIAVVTYGNGLIAALEADLAHNPRLLGLHDSYLVDVIDCRCLSHVPAGLKDALCGTAYDAVLFADPCKFGSHPLNMHFASFVNWHSNGGKIEPDASGKQRQLAVQRFKSVGAEFTYNPLGTKLTFLSASDIVDALLPLLQG